MMRRTNRIHERDIEDAGILAMNGQIDALAFGDDDIVVAVPVDIDDLRFTIAADCIARGRREIVFIRRTRWPVKLDPRMRRIHFQSDENRSFRGGRRRAHIGENARLVIRHRPRWQWWRRGMKSSVTQSESHVRLGIGSVRRDIRNRIPIDVRHDDSRIFRPHFGSR